MHFKINSSSDLKIIGRSFQIEQGIFPVDLDKSPQSTKNFWFEEADLGKLVFPEPIVHSKAKLTDFIPCSIMGNRFMPVVSDKLKGLIEINNNNNPQFIPVNVHYRGKLINGYYYLNVYQFNYDLIDLGKSTIRWDYGYANRHKNTEISIASFADFLKIVDVLKPPIGIKIDPLALNSMADNYDFFSLSWVKGGVGYYVSEKLKSVFENEGLTGIDYFGLNDVI